MIKHYFSIHFHLCLDIDEQFFVQASIHVESTDRNNSNFHSIIVFSSHISIWYTSLTLQNTL